MNLEWKDWGIDKEGNPDPVFASANFIWTSLHDFGGTDSLRGNLSAANEIPFLALEHKVSDSVLVRCATA
jgi:hypothetical protein